MIAELLKWIVYLLLSPVAESNASLQIKKAEYYQTAETKERQAHAAVEEAEYLAQAKANLALAEKVVIILRT